MLHEALQARIETLLEQARADSAELLAEASPASHLARLVEERINASIETLVLETQLRPAVRARPALAKRWPLCVSSAPTPSHDARVLRCLWQFGLIDGREATDIDLLTEAYGLIATVEHEVSEDRRRAAMAIDAGHPHHSLVSGMRDIPKDGMRKRGAKAQLPVDNGYARVLAPNGSSAQLHFPLAGLNESILETLREWRGPKGLRHWAALQRLLSVEGGRSGRVTWRLDEHLDAIGYAERTRRNPDVRADVAKEVELLTQLELAVYDSQGKLRLRQALVTPITKAERQIEGTDTWALEGLDLVIHPLLYDGVRDPKTGQIGSHWYPQTTELAKLDDVRFPYAIPLGLVLPIRWRWSWTEGRDHCALSGASLLNAAGIPHINRRSDRAWLALRKTLDELLHIKALGRYEWEREPETLNGLCRLYPPEWAVDRTVHALPPIEKPHTKLPANGRELREWRKRKEWTQEQLAKRLIVSLRTIEAAESNTETPLGPAIRKNIHRLRDAPGPAVDPQTTRKKPADPDQQM
jgi:hypothetical protein